MKRITHTNSPLIEAKSSEPLNELPSTLRYMNTRYFDYERELAHPKTSDPGTWKKWRSDLRRRLRQTFRLDTMGNVPTPSPQVLEESQEDGYRRYKLAYETLPNNWARAFLLVPDGGPKRKPAAICPHGHVPGCMRGVAIPDPDSPLGVAYGHELAKRGVIVLAPESAGMGERQPATEHQKYIDAGGCFLLWTRLNHMGMDLTGLRIFELMAGLNLLQSRDDVISSRIGAAGLSGGCWLSQVLTALDRRVKACILSGFFTTFPQTIWHCHCICHHPFGIGQYCDMPDISALIAPRPLFVESGIQDPNFPHQPAFDMTQRIYEQLAAPDNIGLHRYDGGHMFHGGESIPWLVDRLKGL